MAGERLQLQIYPLFWILQMVGKGFNISKLRRRAPAVRPQTPLKNCLLLIRRWERAFGVGKACFLGSLKFSGEVVKSTLWCAAVFLILGNLPLW